MNLSIITNFGCPYSCGFCISSSQNSKNNYKFKLKDARDIMNLLKSGTVVKLQTRLLKIKESKLQYLRIIYGRCLSEKQINKIKSDLYEDDSHDNNLSINYTDLETVDNRVLTGIVSGINPFGYYFSEYCQHSNSFIGSNNHCVHYVHKPNLTLATPGKDFEDYFTWTKPEIIEILSPEESSKYLEKQKDFYSNLTGIN